MRFRMVFLWLMAFGLLALAGGLLVSQLQPRSGLPTGMLMLKDDFSNPYSGWTVWNTTESQVVYRDGGLWMAVHRPQLDIWSQPQISYGDVRMEVDAVKLNGPDENNFGLVCRLVDDDNYYALLVGSDGSAAIFKVKDGEMLLLNTAGDKSGNVIHPGDGRNHLRADCVGPRLILSVNGRKLVEARDHDFRNGGVGLMAGTFDEAELQLLFDDFLVYNP